MRYFYGHALVLRRDNLAVGSTYSPLKQLQSTSAAGRSHAVLEHERWRADAHEDG